MTVCYSHKKSDPFVRLDKRIVYDSKLSWKAKGILAYAFSRSANWKFFKSEIMSHAKDGEASFDSGIEELEETRYLYRIRKQNKETGTFEGWEWHFFEEPISEEEFKKFIRNGGFTGIGETTPYNKNESYTKKEGQTDRQTLVSPQYSLEPKSLDKEKEKLIHKIMHDNLLKDFFYPDELQELFSKYPLEAIRGSLRRLCEWIDERHGKIRKSPVGLLKQFLEHEIKKLKDVEELDRKFYHPLD